MMKLLPLIAILSVGAWSTIVGCSDGGTAPVRGKIKGTTAYSPVDTYDANAKRLQDEKNLKAEEDLKKKNNRAPVVEAIGTQTVTAGSSIRVAVNAYDPERNTLSYKLVLPQELGGAQENAEGQFVISVPADFDSQTIPGYVSVSEGEPYNLVTSVSFDIQIVAKVVPGSSQSAKIIKKVTDTACPKIENDWLKLGCEIGGGLLGGGL
jgi:hypothetical protein